MTHFKGLIFFLVLVFFSSASLGEILSSNNQKSQILVQVNSEGKTLDEAKQIGFRSAIEEAVGFLGISREEWLDDSLIIDSFKTYSAGYISDYEIIKQAQRSDGWYLLMNVKVTSSKIALIFKSSNNPELKVLGSKIQASIDSNIRQRDDGDQLLGTVFSQYPTNAYIVKANSTVVGINNLRQPTIDIPWEINMSQTWLEALDEALTLVSLDGSECSGILKLLTEGLRNNNYSSQGDKTMANLICNNNAPDIKINFKKSGSFFSTSKSYKLQDLRTLDLINYNFGANNGRPKIGLLMEGYDNMGNVVNTHCFNISTGMGYGALNNTPGLSLSSGLQGFISYSNMQPIQNNWQTPNDKVPRPEIFGSNKISGVVRANITPGSNTDSIKFSITDSCSAN